MASPILLILGLAVLGLGCLTFQHPLIRKTGLLGFMGATAVLFYWISDNVLIGLAGALLWFGLPWIELLTRVRRMDLPVDKPLRRRIPPNEDFPFLGDTTDEIEASGGFELIDDCGYEWQNTEHFFRFFYDPSRRVQAGVCMIQDDSFLHAYVKLVSRSSAGTVYTTWNYPFSASLKLSPEHRLHWDRNSETFEALLESHLHFIEKKRKPGETIDPQDATAFQESLRKDQRRLVDHNLALGFLKASGEGCCRYTWRGLLFLWAQLVKDMVRLH